VVEDHLVPLAQELRYVAEKSTAWVNYNYIRVHPALVVVKEFEDLSDKE